MTDRGGRAGAGSLLRARGGRGAGTFHQDALTKISQDVIISRRGRLQGRFLSSSSSSLEQRHLSKIHALCIRLRRETQQHPSVTPMPSLRSIDSQTIQTIPRHCSCFTCPLCLAHYCQSLFQRLGAGAGTHRRCKCARDGTERRAPRRAGRLECEGGRHDGRIHRRRFQRQ